MPVEAVNRASRVEISRSALENNIATLRAVSGGVALAAVVKANGYGVGAVQLATIYQENNVAMLCVALVDEGIELRANAVTIPILVFAELDEHNTKLAFENGLIATIGSVEGARFAVLCAKQLGGMHRVHVKLDTGMHRLGVDRENLDAVLDVLTSSQNIEIDGFYTHFSVADESNPDHRSFTRTQIDLFNEAQHHVASRGIEVKNIHLANTAGAVAFKEAHGTMVRCGLGLLGVAPQLWLESVIGESGMTLRQAVSLHSKVSAVRRVPAGARPSYGRRRELEIDSNIATVPYGYADGYARSLFAGGAEVLINAKRYQLAGQITMDQIVVDCGDDEVKIGDDVVLLGQQGDEFISANELAERLDTIAYEIFTMIATRVARVVVS